MAKVLVLYYTRQYPMRASQRDFLFSFKKHALGHECFYLNAFTNFYFSNLKKQNFDLVILTWSFLDSRFMRENYLRLLEKFSFINDFSCPKIMMPQDEFSHTDLLCKTREHFHVNNIFSVCPESEWAKVYKTIDFSKVKFYQLLTGYIEDSLVSKIEAISKKTEHKRLIDVGYRSGSAVYWGRFNLIKFRIADEFLKISSKHGIISDIKFGWQNFLKGDEWYRFLLNCKYIPGVEGGSSVVDWDGSLVDCVQNYLKINPNADYDDVEKHCISAGRDGEINVKAISPRHLEACLTKTCQILIEGSYNGVLESGKHYISLEEDFSNLDEIIDKLGNEDMRTKIVNQSYAYLTISGKYSYRSMVTQVLGKFKIKVPNKKNNFYSLSFIINNTLDYISLFYVMLFSLVRSLRDKLNN